MDIDALVNTKNVLLAGTFNKTERLLLTSAINTQGIDINLSINDNLKNIIASSQNKKELINNYTKEFLIDNPLFMETPIFIFLYYYKELWKILLACLKNNLLTKENTTFVINNLFSTLIKKEDYATLVFLEDILNLKKVNYATTVSNLDVLLFVKNNLSCLEELDNKQMGRIIKKQLIIRLFTLGLIRFSDFVLIDTDPAEILTEVITAFLNNGECFYLISIFNEATIDVATRDIILPIFREYLVNSSSENREFIAMLIAKLKQSKGKNLTRNEKC